MTLREKMDALLEQKKNHPCFEQISNAVALILMKTEQMNTVGSPAGENMFLNNHIPLWLDGSYCFPDNGIFNDGTKDVKISWSVGKNIEDDKGVLVLGVAPYNLQQKGGNGSDVTMVTGTLILKTDKDIAKQRVRDLDFIIREDYDDWEKYPGMDNLIYEKILDFYLKFFKFSEWTEETKKNLVNLSKNFQLQDKFIKAVCEEFKLDPNKSEVIGYVTDKCVSDPLELFKFYFETTPDEFPKIEIDVKS